MMSTRPIIFREHDPNIIIQKWLNNPSQKAYEAIPRIEQRYRVVIKKYWSESYHSTALLISGPDSDEAQAYQEMVQIENAIMPNVE